MAYNLEKITQADQAKILEDAAPNRIRQERLAYAIKHQELTESWAVDKERNCYLLQMPTITREEDWDTPYLVFVSGRMYRVNRVGQAGNRFYFDEETLSSDALLLPLQSEIKAAFAVYGCWGRGPSNVRGAPVWAVEPQFVEFHLNLTQLGQ